MNKRIYLFLFLLFILPSLFLACSAEDIKMDSTLESMQNSKSSGVFPLDIDMLNTDKYKEEIEEYLIKLNPKIDILKSNYQFGDLDGDLFPELVVYVERDPKELNDQGALLVYKLINNEYKELDRVSMNYDNANYVLKLGMLSNDQAGILLSNQVGVKAAVTYGFILENGKLKNILNPKRINLISFYAMDYIEDIDQDGVLEFGILTIDPETEETNAEDANKIILWYKWDGIDGAIFVRKDIVENQSIKKSRASGTIDSLIPGSEYFLEKLQKNIDGYPKSELSSLLSFHIKNLELNSTYNSLDIAALFSKYIKNSSLLDLLEAYNLTNNKINDLNYIKKDKVLENESDLKSLLISNLNKGYYLILDDGRYLYTPDYYKFGSEFSKTLSKELQGYLSIMSKSQDIPYRAKNILLIDKIDLAKRLEEIENYRITYSYSDHLENINTLYKDYLEGLLFYTAEGEIIIDSKIVSDKEINKFVDIVNSYPESYFSQVINELLALLNKNQNFLSPEMWKKISQMIR